MNYIDYRKKLGIGWDNEDNAKAFRVRFINLLNVLADEQKSYYDEEVSRTEYLSFCNNAAIQYDDNYGGQFLYSVISDLGRSDSFEEFLVRCVALINCFKDKRKSKYYAESIKRLLEDSYIKTEIICDEDGFFIFPQGAKELDAALVSDVLLWVKEYPKTYKKYCEALRRYADGAESPSVIADDFRKVLETFFQELFNTNKSLENIISDYGVFLKEKGLPSEISNDFVSTIKAYSHFNNNYAKHHDDTSILALEYIMYQTGNIIRLLVRLAT